MKISVDGQEILNLSEIKKKVIMNDIHSDEFDEDMKRRLSHILLHKFECCYKRMKEEWEPKLAQRGIKSIPLDEEEFATLVFSQSDYMDRKSREFLNPRT